MLTKIIMRTLLAGAVLSVPIGYFALQSQQPGMPARVTPVRLDGEELQRRAQNSGAPWAIAETKDALRFEVRPGDRWKGDAEGTKERSEVYYPQKMMNDATYELHYSFMIEPGPVNTADWLSLSQIQSTFLPTEEGHSPPYALEMREDRMRIVSRTSQVRFAKNDDSTYTLQFQDDQPLERGKWYAMRTRVRFDPEGAGRLQVWRNGDRLVDYSGPLGFYETVGAYLKLGIYRGHADEPMAVQFKDVSMGRVSPS